MPMIEVLEEVKRLIKICRTSRVLDGRSREDLEVQAVTAMLLLEAAYGDEEYVWCEHRSIELGLRRTFGLSASFVRKRLQGTRTGVWLPGVRRIQYESAEKYCLTESRTRDRL